MTTFASPTQGQSSQALWQVDMAPGAQGPVHAMDGEQIWTVLAGGATVVVDGESPTLGPGDTVVLPPGTTRQILADGERGLTAVVTGRGATVATGPGREPVVPPWLA